MASRTILQRPTRVCPRMKGKNNGSRVDSVKDRRIGCRPFISAISKTVSHVWAEIAPKITQFIFSRQRDVFAGLVSARLQALAETTAALHLRLYPCARPRLSALQATGSDPCQSR